METSIKRQAQEMEARMALLRQNASSSRNLYKEKYEESKRMRQQESKALAISKFEDVLGNMFKRTLQHETTKVLEQVKVPLFNSYVKKELFPHGKLEIKKEDESDKCPAGTISAELHNKLVAEIDKMYIKKFNEKQLKLKS